MPRRKEQPDAPVPQAPIGGDSRVPSVDQVHRLAEAIQKIITITGPFTPRGMIGPDGKMHMEVFEFQWHSEVQLRANAIGYFLRPFGQINERIEDWHHTRGWPPYVRDAAARTGATLRRITTRWGIPEALRGELSVQHFPGKTTITPNDEEPGSYYAELLIPKAGIPEGEKPRMAALIVNPDEWEVLEWCFGALGAALIPFGLAHLKSDRPPPVTPPQEIPTSLSILEEVFECGHDSNVPARLVREKYLANYRRDPDTRQLYVTPGPLAEGTHVSQLLSRRPGQRKPKP
jgi:hypothetical protein